MGILWTILIGFVAGVLAKLITPGDNEPSGFILTTILGIVGAFVASFLGQALGWYNAGEGAGLIGATVGAIIVLLVWASLLEGGGALFPRTHPPIGRRAFLIWHTLLPDKYIQILNLKGGSTLGPPSR
jgi:uncharacterized membrane protein YeaQ/YmgE (transglycosylase-associated protein family)